MTLAKDCNDCGGTSEHYPNCPRYRRTCIMCEHFTVDYEAGWSEYTPGSGLQFDCSRQHWSVSSGDQAKDVRRMLKMAVDCPQFEKAKDEP